MLYYKLCIYGGTSGSDSHSETLIYASPHSFVSPLGTECFISTVDALVEHNYQILKDFDLDEGLDLKVVAHLDNTWGGFGKDTSAFYMLLGLMDQGEPEDGEVSFDDVEVAKALTETLKSMGWEKFR